MILPQALRRIALPLHVDADDLIAYAAEDNVGGWDGGAGRWPCGSLWSVEGQFLYALVRALRPAHVLEIGCLAGASSTHILAAMDVNRHGELVSLDIDGNAGYGIPPELRYRWTFYHQDAQEWIKQYGGDFPLVFEDGSHIEPFTSEVLTLVKTRLNPHVVISHDAEHPTAGGLIRRAFGLVMGRMDTVLIEPADCGFAWWVR
jgi:hypothetical protein